MDQPPKITEVRQDQPEAVHFAKLAIDVAPLVAFFAAYLALGIYWATGALMAATCLSMLVSWFWLGRVSAPLIITTLVVVAFGALTLYLNDPRFIMMKPTIVNLLFAAALAVGLVMRKPLLQLMMGHAFRLNEEGWHKLTLRWIAFFIAMAMLNEIIWRNFSETFWASFKVFGILPLTAVFAMLQVGLLQHYKADDASDGPGPH